MTTSTRGGSARACQLPRRRSKATSCAAAAALAQVSSGLLSTCLRCAAGPQHGRAEAGHGYGAQHASATGHFMMGGRHRPASLQRKCAQQ